MNKNIVFKQPRIQNAYFLHEQFLKKKTYLVMDTSDNRFLSKNHKTMLEVKTKVLI